MVGDRWGVVGGFYGARKDLHRHDESDIAGPPISGSGHASPMPCGFLAGPTCKREQARQWGRSWAARWGLVGREGEWRGGSTDYFRPMSTNLLYFFLKSFSLISKLNLNSNLFLSLTYLNAQAKKTISMNAHIFMITYLLTIIFIYVSAPKTYKLMKNISQLIYIGKILCECVAIL